LGSCMPLDTISSEEAQRLGRDSCQGDGLLCAPTDLLDPTVAPTSCQTTAEREGRCLPTCVPAAAALSSSPTDACPQTHRCVPCFDRASGADTGACRWGNDAPSDEPPGQPPPRDPPTDPPPTDGSCCGGRGSCVAESNAPPNERPALDQESCAAGQLCAPTSLLDNPSAGFASCMTDGLLSGLPGGCVPDCLVSGLERIALGQSSCAANELCVPCLDVRNGGRSGACRE
jgi:hypothetical protein